MPESIDNAPQRSSNAAHLRVYVALFLVLLLWIYLFPYTGDGDSVLHYLCARTVWADPTAVLGSWARPLHKLLIILPALGGIFPARIAQALLTVALAWQTVSLARQLRLPSAILAAPLVVFQPYVFALASDTMTEIPMALAIVIAVRLWIAGRLGWSCFVVSLLPMLRPEGFFLIALWGILLLLPGLPGERDVPPASASSAVDTRRRHGRNDFNPMRRRLKSGCLLCIGMLCWMAACSLVTRNPFYFLYVWSWPMQSFEAYRPGPIYHYVVLWPVYCGLFFTVPFLAGIRPSLGRRHMWIVWSIWLLVFVLHSLLFWLHKFASVGLVRILACTSPMTAIICLEGFNAIARWLACRGFKPEFRRRLAWTAVVSAMLWAMFYYMLLGVHYHCFGYRAILRETATRHLLKDYLRQQSAEDRRAPRLIAGDKMFLAMLGMISDPPHFMAGTMDSATREAEQLASQPIGSIGAWDNEQSQAWHSVAIDDLPALGYTIVYEYDQSVPDLRDCLARRSIFSRQRYVVIRKDRP